MKHTTLAIESTCDDSSLALISYEDGNFVVHKMLTHTQGMHAKFGGVVPEYASREHAVWLPKLIQELGIDGLEIDSITVAAQPGLPGSVVAGVAAAHSLGQNYGLPVIQVNHIMGHVFSILLDRHLEILELPYLCLTVSGGHSDIYIVEQSDSGTVKQVDSQGETFHKHQHMGLGEVLQVGPYVVTKLVQTMDDAVGEAFDKVAKMLGGPYPGGPWIQQQAALSSQADVRTTTLSRPDLIHILTQRIRKIDISGQFSFSGIKAQVHSLLEYLERENHGLDDQMIADIAWLFQERVTDAMVGKLEQYIDTLVPNTIGIVGGVSANAILQEKAKNLGKKIYLPTQMKYCTDNAAMIGVVGLLELIT